VEHIHSHLWNTQNKRHAPSPYSHRVQAQHMFSPNYWTSNKRHLLTAHLNNATRGIEDAASTLDIAMDRHQRVDAEMKGADKHAVMAAATELQRRLDSAPPPTTPEGALRYAQAKKKLSNWRSTRNKQSFMNDFGGWVPGKGFQGMSTEEAQAKARQEEAMIREEQHQAEKKQRHKAEERRRRTAEAARSSQTEAKRRATSAQGPRSSARPNDGWKQLLKQYEQHWRVLEASPSAICYLDVGWPDTDKENELLFYMMSHTKSNSEKKKLLKSLQLRWHPDKFLAKFGERLQPGGERDRIMARVMEICQLINASME